MVKSIENYRHYLLGRMFTLRTDHKALIYLVNAKNPSSRLLRYSLKLQEYTFKIEHVKGEDNIADGCSRTFNGCNTIASIISERVEDNKDEILKQYHDISGHGSKNTLKFMISRNFSWKGMYKDIEKYIDSCEICIRSGDQRVNTKNRVIYSQRPNELWEIDLIGRIPDGDKNKFFFVAIDHYSKWIETKVINNKSGLEISQAIRELILDKHGIPEKIMSDCGSEFLNKEFSLLKTTHGITWVHSSPYHHKTTGAVERVNGTLMRNLRNISNFGKTKWSSLVKKATLSVNVSFHRALGTSLYIFKYGKQIETEIDRKLGCSQPVLSKAKMIAERNKNFEKYAIEIVKGKVEIKERLKIGDEVLIFRDPVTNKMKEKWQPGYTVTDLVLPDAYIVKKNNSSQFFRINKCHIKLNTTLNRWGGVVVP
ncbi:Transposon Tf2-8 polyprotein [Nosema granulosis]|uniref:Transposon Tf2-8 polyprotein n=1 Tax=Nosema granulosis TaxID=83296 RepID=A0A9P6KXV9_9MICR|nr:Transposon Tf2-8 polyprotein [Nosema granulosis]